MEYLAAYDISDPKRLKKLGKAMKRFGVRVQKSVFECDLDQSKSEEMKSKIQRIMSKDEDSFRLYPLLDESRSRQEIIGQGSMVVFPSYYIVSESRPAGSPAV